MFCCKQLVSVIIFCAISLNSQTCDEGQRDVVILLDSSGSVKARNFHKAKLFVKNFVDDLQIAADKVQVSLILFNTKPKKIFWLNDFSDKTKIKKAVMKIPYRGGSTATAQALHFTNEYVLLNDHGNREAAPDLIIVITDGQSNKPGETISSAKVLHDRGVDIVSIGVGDKVDVAELHSIASDSNFAIQVDSFDKLDSLKTTLFQAACEGLKATTRRTTTIEITSARPLTDTTVATDSTEQTESDRSTSTVYQSYNTRSLITVASEDFTSLDSSATTSESFKTPNPSGTTVSYITNVSKPGRYSTTTTNSRTKASFKSIVDLDIETTTSTTVSTPGGGDLDDVEGTSYSNMAERHTTLPFTTSTLDTKKAQQPLSAEIPEELMTTSSKTRSSRSFVKSTFTLPTFQSKFPTFKNTLSKHENHSTTDLDIETTTSTTVSTPGGGDLEDVEGTSYSNMAERHTTLPFTTSTLVTKKAQQPLSAEIPEELMTTSSKTRSSRSFVKSTFTLPTFQTKFPTFKNTLSKNENHSTTESFITRSSRSFVKSTFTLPTFQTKFPTFKNTLSKHENHSTTESFITRSSPSFVKSTFTLPTFQTKFPTFKKTLSKHENHSTTETVRFTDNDINPVTVSFQNKTTMVNPSTKGADKLNFDESMKEWAAIVGITTGAAILGAAAFGILIWVFRRRCNRESDRPTPERDV